MSEKEAFPELRMVPPKPPLRILVADDEDNARNLNTRLLTRARYEVVGAWMVPLLGKRSRPNRSIY
jgi:hypothetical protein